MIQIGRPAPAFKLPDQDGNPVSPGDFKGRWIVLYFYPKDDTPGCTKQACQFTDALRDFQKLDAVVLGCSPDDAPSHRRFIAKHKLKITLLSDESREVMEKYGAWGEKNLYGKVTTGVIRSTVVIDPSGRVAHHWKKVQADGHAQKVRQKLAELRAG
jgi:peroxiredoxin Q/BCP